MKSLLLLSLLLSSCIHTTPTTIIRENRELDLNKIDRLEYRINYLEYEGVNNLCFYQKAICEVNSTQRCRGECLISLKKICWTSHEKCIINNYNRWKNVKGMFK